MATTSVSLILQLPRQTVASGPVAPLLSLQDSLYYQFLFKIFPHNVNKAHHFINSPPTPTMQVSAFPLVPPFFHRPSAVVFPKSGPASVISPPWLRRQAAALRCVNQGGWASSVAELERKLAVEGEDWLKLGWLEEKCGGGGKGVVELLECLEREAIMGEDEGRDPTDYNRRAKIFSTSSRVFQALKQHSDDESEEEE